MAVDIVWLKLRRNFDRAAIIMAADVLLIWPTVQGKVAIIDLGLTLCEWTVAQRLP